MEVRYKKIKQCIQRTVRELSNILDSLQISTPFSSFQYNTLDTQLKEVINTFNQIINQWVHQKIKKGQITKDTFTEKKCKQYADQQYQQEADLFMSCFQEMINYLNIRCNIIRDVSLRIEIELLMIELFALMVLKMTHKWELNSGHHPVFRAKALVVCTELHYLLDGKHPELSISDWIAYRKQKAKEFRSKFIEYLECLFHERYHRLCSKMRLNIANTIDIFVHIDGKNVCDQKITICNGLETVNYINIQNKKGNIMKYFGVIERQILQSFSEHVPVSNDECKENESASFPDYDTNNICINNHNIMLNTSGISTSPTYNQFNHLMPPFQSMHDMSPDYCNIDKVSALEQQLKAQTLRVEELQQQLVEKDRMIERLKRESIAKDLNMQQLKREKETLRHRIRINERSQITYQHHQHHQHQAQLPNNTAYNHISPQYVDGFRIQHIMHNDQMMVNNNYSYTPI